MTEAEWLACDDPRRMLAWVRDWASERKFRLFAAACCRRIWLLLQAQGWGIVGVAERYADGLAYHLAPGTLGLEWAATENADWRAAHDAERSAQALLRDLVGAQPRKPLAGPNRAIFGVAQAAYDERALPGGHLDNARLAVLSDALEEAGYAEADLLTHLRSPGPHVRGCWALDLVLGKE